MKKKQVYITRASMLTNGPETEDYLTAENVPILIQRSTGKKGRTLSRYHSYTQKEHRVCVILTALQLLSASESERDCICTCIGMVLSDRWSLKMLWGPFSRDGILEVSPR